MKKTLFILSLAILIPLIGISQKYVGIKSLRAPVANETNYAPDDDRAGMWLTWAKNPGRNVYKFDGTSEYGPFLRFAVSDLTEHVGKVVKRIRYCPAVAQGHETEFYANPRIQVYLGGSVDEDVPEYEPGNLMVDEVVTSYKLGQNNIFTLPTPITIPANKELWFGVIFYVTDGYPMLTTDVEDPVVIQNSVRPLKSDLVFFYDQEGWESMTERGVDVSWVQAAFIEETCNPATALSITYNPECTLATLTWTAPSDNPTAKYNIYRDNTNIALDYTGTTYEDNKFNPGQEHVWKVTAICESGSEGESAILGKPACSACTTPTLTVKYVDNCDAVELTWNNDGTIKNFDLWRDNTQIATKITETSFKDTGCDKEKGNTYKLRANCEIGDSEVSEKTGKCIGINDNVLSFSIAPNPAINEIKITSSHNINRIEVINFIGQNVISQSTTETEVTVDISTLNSGIYFVRVISENGTNVQKFVKK
jgi:hypothetical protein